MTNKYMAELIDNVWQVTEWASPFIVMHNDNKEAMSDAYDLAEKLNELSDIGLCEGSSCELRECDCGDYC